MATKIYVGNLPYTCDEPQLRELFGSDGRNVADVAIVTDRMTGQPRGFAFVNMASAVTRRSAIDALHGSLFGGRTLTVNEARPKEGGGGWRRRLRRGGRGRERRRTRRATTGDGAATSIVVEALATTSHLDEDRRRSEPRPKRIS